MNKIKIEIKSRWIGRVLFEYEKENNTIKQTLEKAVEEGAVLEGSSLEGANLRGADLRGAYLRGADLEGADLRGAYLEGADLRGAYLEGSSLEGANLRGADLYGAYIYVNDNCINVNEIVKELENNSNLKIKETYINKNIIPTRWSSHWKYGLIICDWEVKQPKKKMTIDEIQKELGYEIEIVEVEND